MNRFRAFLWGFAITAVFLAGVGAYSLGIMWLHDHDHMLASGVMALFGVCVMAGATCAAVVDF